MKTGNLKADGGLSVPIMFNLFRLGLPITLIAMPALSVPTVPQRKEVVGA